MAVRQTFDIQFYCRPSKVNKKGYAPVELSIIINGERNYLTLQRKEEPAAFKAALQSKKTNPIKSFCENQKRLIDEYVEQMRFEGVEISAKNLKDCLVKGYVSQAYSLGDMWRDILDNERGKLSVGDIEETTYYKYGLARKAFYAATDFNDSTPAQEVDIQTINQYQNYLRNDMGLVQATAYNYHSRAKAAFTLAFNRGKIRSNPYAGFKMDKGVKKDIVWLTEDEVKRIADKTFSTKRLNDVKDCFLFQCFSGLSYGDMAGLKKEDFNRIDGRLVVNKRRLKTNEEFIAVILDGGEDILKRHNYELPVLSNQNYNTYLKEIQDVCGIQKNLHSHLGRATYATFLRNKGMGLDVIKNLLGHSRATTTAAFYAGMDKKAIVQAVEQAVTGSQTAVVSGDSSKSFTIVNEYFDSTIFVEGKPASLATLQSMEDKVIGELTALCKNPDATTDYRALFTKCAAKVKERIAFVERKIKVERKYKRYDNVKSLHTLELSYKRLRAGLIGLNDKLYNAV